MFRKFALFFSQRMSRRLILLRHIQSLRFSRTVFARYGQHERRIFPEKGRLSRSEKACLSRRRISGSVGRGGGWPPGGFFAPEPPALKKGVRDQREQTMMMQAAPRTPLVNGPFVPSRQMTVRHGRRPHGHCAGPLSGKNSSRTAISLRFLHGRRTATAIAVACRIARAILRPADRLVRLRH